MDRFTKSLLRKPKPSKRVSLNRWKRAHKGIRQYGITPRQADAIQLSQNHGCAICGRKPTKKALALDHDHATGLARGWLCPECNWGLGCFRDKPYLLQRAIDYVRRGAIVPELSPDYSYSAYVTHRKRHPEMNPKHVPRTITIKVSSGNSCLTPESTLPPAMQHDSQQLAQNSLIFHSEIDFTPPDPNSNS